MIRDLGISIIGGLISSLAVGAILKWEWNVGWVEIVAISVMIFILIAWIIQSFIGRTHRQDSDNIIVKGNGEVKIATRSGQINGEQKPKQ